MPELSRPVHDPEVHWDVRIPVRDGLELSANLWLPVPRPGVPGERFPVILEMIPYGKDNWRRNSDTARGEWLAARGFALCRLDVRGTGSSPGVALDEYTEAETLDGYDAVEWLAAQPWCNGNVGMWGISYGGFTSIQVAKLRPPHLRAILPMYATDDRYRDDVHIRGGCVTASEKCQYAVSQLGMNAMPPHPPFRGSTWRDEWLARLEATPPWLFPWVREQLDGPYWRRGSLAPDYDALECAVFQVAGWSDAYVDAAFRIQERCRNARVRTLVGNWVHSYPGRRLPGPEPRLDARARALLRPVPQGRRERLGARAGARLVRARVRRARGVPGRVARPVAGVGRLPDCGRRGRSRWSWTGIRAAAMGSLGSDRRRGAPRGSTRCPTGRPWAPAARSSWGAGGSPNGLARDLRADEASGITYTTEPLDDGAVRRPACPEVILRIGSTMPVATCVVRLSEVSPSGASSHVATGVLNLTHRRSDTSPRADAAGRRTRRRSASRSGPPATASRRVTGSASRSSPRTGRSSGRRRPKASCGSTVAASDASRLVLPVLGAAAVDLPVPAFRTEPVVMRDVGGSEEDEPEWRIEEDVLRGTVTVTIFEGGASTQEDGSRLYSSERLALTASDPDPAHASLDSDVVYRWTGFGADADIRATGRIASDAEAFDVSVALDVRLDGEPFFAREWQERIPRRLV